jgi:hypothetical protein
VKFTPSQTQALVGLTAETLRYWKKHLPPIAAKRGHAPCYSRGEVLALIVVRRLVRDFKMDVSVLGANAPKLFEVCSSSSQWPRLVPQWLVVTASGVVSARESLSEPLLVDPAVVFPVEVAIRELDDKLTAQDAEPQLELSLPPVVISRAAGRAS